MVFSHPVCYLYMCVGKDKNKIRNRLPYPPFFLRLKKKAGQRAHLNDGTECAYFKLLAKSSKRFVTFTSLTPLSKSSDSRFIWGYNVLMRFSMPLDIT